MKKLLSNPFTKFLIGTLCVVLVVSIGVFAYLFTVYNPDGLQPLTSSAARNQYAINNVTNPPTGGNDGGLCREQNPSVGVTPNISSTYPGGPIEYTIAVTNSGCASYNYTIDVKLPSPKWTKTLTSTTMIVAKGATERVGLTLSSPLSIGKGSYPFDIIATTVNNGSVLSTKVGALYTVADPVIELFTVNGNIDNPTLKQGTIIEMAWRCANTITSNIKNNNNYILVSGGNSGTFKKERVATGSRTYTLTCFGGINNTGPKTSKSITVTGL